MAITEAPINRFAAGLLGLVDIKAMGKNPSRLTESVAGVLELEHFYRAEGRSFVGYGEPVVVTTGFLAAGGASTTVPQSKIWLVESIRLAFAGIPVNGIIAGSPCIARINGVSQEAFWCGPRSEPFGPVTATDAFSGIAVAYTFEKPFIMLPGMKLAMDISRASQLGAGAQATVTATVSVVDY